MRLLCIETSSRRGSVVLAEGTRLVVRATHAEQSAHAERLRPLLDQVLAEAGWSKTQIDRLGVGMGPGSFTGLRVGIAFAQGIALGLDRPLIGVGSLEAMVAACPQGLNWPRVALLDARRDEVFAQAFAEGGVALAPAEALPRGSAIAALAARHPAAAYVGEIATELGAPAVFRAETTDLPDATGVAALVALRGAEASVREPLYVRDSGATPQNLPPSPIGPRAG